MTRSQYRVLALSALVFGTLSATPAFASGSTTTTTSSSSSSSSDSSATSATPARPGPGMRERGGMFQNADTNKDGFLTKEEMLAAQQQHIDKMFTSLDTNKDGKLSQDEVQAGRNKMRERMKERRAGRNGGGAPAETMGN